MRVALAVRVLESRRSPGVPDILCQPRLACSPRFPMYPLWAKDSSGTRTIQTPPAVIDAEGFSASVSAGVGGVFDSSARWGV